MSPDPALREKAFVALPPLGSNEYVDHIRRADTAAMPPEVLARAFRQLPPGCDAAKATLERLFFRRQNGRWDYLGPLVAFARRKSKPNDYEDALQDAFRRILEILPTARGEFAERAWHSFCCRELSEAWRQRWGRHGGRLLREDSIDGEYNHENGDFLPAGLRSRFSHIDFKPNQVTSIEKIAQRVASELPNEFVRAVALAIWFQDERPKQSGVADSLVGDVPLTTLFPGKSRFQIMRAQRSADGQLAAALLAEPNLDLERDWHSVLEILKANAPRQPRRARERSQ
jgi:DNA-directed RNA polymerase specialized sigma24 family protein